MEGTNGGQLSLKVSTKTQLDLMKAKKPTFFKAF
jgi:hypothetical protein